jgi:hypothetical protein
MQAFSFVFVLPDWSYDDHHGDDGKLDFLDPKKWKRCLQEYSTA